MMDLDKMFDMNGDGVLDIAEKALKYQVMSGELFDDDDDEEDDEE